MNNEMRAKLGVDENIIGSQFEDILTVGSKIFFQTHFYPMIKMQNSAREIYLSFKGAAGTIPVLLDVGVKNVGDLAEVHCGGMEISNRNRFEKELIEAKKAAEEALAQNAELMSVKKTLIENHQILESQYRKLKSLKEQQQELFKLIAHDLQEPLRKSVFFSNYLLTESGKLPKDVVEKLSKIIGFNSDMRDMLLALQRFEELDSVSLNYTPVDLREIVAEAIAKLDLSQDKAAISYPSSCPAFLGDKGMLTNLFIELLRNSQKNKDPGHEKLAIDIAAVETHKNIFIESADKYQYEKFLKLTYIDNGLGFNTDRQKFKIIQKSAEFNKISLGLAFCKRIVEKHSGHIVAKSVKGKGIGYTIFLPLKNPIDGTNLRPVPIL